jgi:hypothetical protein
MTKWFITLIRDELAKKLFWLILAALAGIALLAIREAQRKIDPLALSLAIVLVVVIVTFAIIEIARRTSYRFAWYPHVRFNFEVLSKKITYRIDSNGNLHYSRRLIVKAMQDNMDGFTDRFVWTGGPCDTPSGAVGVSSVETRLVAGIWTFFHVNFDRTLRKGEEHEFEVIWPVLNNWTNSSPFVSASTDEPTRSLVFEVIIPESELSSSAALLEELRGIEAIYPFKTERVQFDNNRLLIAPRPKLYRHYRVRWSWAGSGAVTQIPDIAAVTIEHRELTS